MLEYKKMKDFLLGGLGHEARLMGVVQEHREYCL